MRLVICDQHAGRVAALRRGLQGAAHQRCRIHFARNLSATVPKSQQEMVAAAFRTVFACATRAEIKAQYGHVADILASRFGKTAALMAGPNEELLGFAGFPRSQWRNYGRPTLSSASIKT